MKIKKFICTATLALALCAVAALPALAADSGSEDFIYEYDDYYTYTPAAKQTAWYEDLSIVPAIVSVAASSVTVYVFHRKLVNHRTEDVQTKIKARHKIISEKNRNS